MEKVQYNDYPILTVAAEAREKIDRLGATVWQKWTCQHCGSRQTMEQENTFYRSGRCEECGQVTLIEKCNYMMYIGGK